MSKKHPKGSPLGTIISEAIAELGIKESVIAARMKVSRQVVNRIIDRKTFDLEFLQKLKDATGLDYTDYIFNPKQKKYEPIKEGVLISEPEANWNEKKTLTIELKVTGSYESVGLNFAGFLSALQKETEKYGFKIE